MLKQQVVVMYTKGSHAWVRPVQAGACNGCAGKGCSAVSISHLFLRRDSCYRVTNSAQAVTGDEVEVVFNDEGLLKYIALMFLVPLLVLIVCASLAEILTAGAPYSEAVSIFAGIAGLVMWLKYAPVVFGKLNRIHEPAIVDKRPSNDSEVTLTRIR